MRRFRPMPPDQLDSAVRGRRSVRQAAASCFGPTASRCHPLPPRSQEPARPFRRGTRGAVAFAFARNGPEKSSRALHVHEIMRPEKGNARGAVREVKQPPADGRNQSRIKRRPPFRAHATVKRVFGPRLVRKVRGRNVGRCRAVARRAPVRAACQCVMGYSACKCGCVSRRGENIVQEAVGITSRVQFDNRKTWVARQALFPQGFVACEECTVKRSQRGAIYRHCLHRTGNAANRRRWLR